MNGCYFLFLCDGQRMAAISKRKPNRHTIGATLMRVSLKMSGLKASSVVDPPDMRMNPMIMMMNPMANRM